MYTISSAEIAIITHTSYTSHTYLAHERPSITEIYNTWRATVDTETEARSRVRSSCYGDLFEGRAVFVLLPWGTAPNQVKDAIASNLIRFRIIEAALGFLPRNYITLPNNTKQL